MQIVIDIPDNEYYDTLQCVEWSANTDFENLMIRALKEGTVIPKGHGRLIDADAIPEQIELKGFLKQDNAHLVTIDRVKEALDNTPTIVEADRSEDYD